MRRASSKLFWLLYSVRGEDNYSVLSGMALRPSLLRINRTACYNGLCPRTTRCLAITSRRFLCVWTPLLELLGFDPFCACGEICSVPLLVGLGLIKLAYQGERNRNLKHKLTGAAGSRDHQAMTVAALLTRRESFPLAAAPRLLSYLRPGCRDLYLKVRCSYIKTTADRQTGRQGHACPAGWAESSRAVIDGPGKREQEDALGHRFSQPGTGEPQELGLKKTYSGVKGFNVQGG